MPGRTSHVIGVDIGGTFTDLVGISEGGIYIGKSATVQDDPAEGIAACIREAGVSLGEIDQFRHGSTIAINTVLERKGAKTALVTTEGFRDIYAIGRSNRPEGFNLAFTRPKPLIPRKFLGVRDVDRAAGRGARPGGEPLQAGLQLVQGDGPCVRDHQAGRRADRLREPDMA